jgi:hypothetical protein
LNQPNFPAVTPQVCLISLAIQANALSSVKRSTGGRVRFNPGDWRSISNRANARMKLFVLRVKPLFDSFARLRRKFLRGVMFFALMGRASQEFQLRSVTTAPFAEKKVDPQSKALKKFQRAIQAFGLQPAGLLATRGEQGNYPAKKLHWRVRRFHIVRRHFVRYVR